MISLRDKQVARVKRMLNLNEEIDPEKPSSNIWKVLVFDAKGRDIISSILRVNDLFKCGITVHMLLESERYAIPDVPAIYFVSPTQANIDLIAKDVEKMTYETNYLNFIAPLSRDLLEHLAQKTIAQSQAIAQVYDQYLNFISGEANMFSLGLPKMYYNINNPRATEETVDAYINQMVSGLFSVILTNGSIPIIRASRGNAGEVIAQKLDEKLRNYYLNSKNLGGANTSSANRSVLVILDRNVDLVSMFSHSWIYESLVNDVFEIKRNRIKVDDKTSYDIDPNDFFWNANAALPFPEVADHLDEELSRYKQEAKDLTGATGDMSQVAESSTHLKAAITALPELTIRKGVIDMHMNLATTILKQIGDRGLAQLFEVEENALKQSKATVLEIINNAEFKNPQDKLRMFIIYYLLVDIPASDTADYESALSANGVTDLTPLNYIKKVKDMTRMTMASAYKTGEPAGPAASANDLFSSLSSLRNRITDTKISEGLGNLVSGIRNFSSTSTDLPVTKIVESIMEPPTSASAVDDYLYFDPKSTRGSVSRPPVKTVYGESLVFVVGGGNYIEYNNLQDYAKRTGKHVMYGSTDVCSPKEFLEECTELGQL